MKNLLVAIYDKEVDHFQRLVQVENEVFAVRNMKKLVAQTGEFKDNPSAYALYLMGEFDTDSGKIKVIEPPKHIINLNALVEEVNNGKKDG